MYIYIYVYVVVFELFSDECIPNRASRKFYLTAAGIRTRDLRISRTMLYRLSYKVKLRTTCSQLDLVAQTVEHRSRNTKVAGSNPSRGQVEFSACPVWYTCTRLKTTQKPLHNITRVES